MIVIGSTHRGGIGRVLPGSVGERLLHGAPCAVMVAPAGSPVASGSGSRRIGVGYDGKTEASHAREVAAALAASSARRWRRSRSPGTEAGARRPDDAAKELVERSRELDLLVVGSRGYGPVRQALLGGVSAS